MKNNSIKNSKLDRAATSDEVRIATLLQSDPGVVSPAPNEYHCEVISETGERSRMSWFDLEFFAESKAKVDPNLN